MTKVVKEVYNEYDHPDNIFSTWYNYDFNGNLFSENVSARGKSTVGIKIKHMEDNYELGYCFD